MIIGWVIVLFIGVMSAWYLGFYMHQEQAETRKIQLPKDYLVGLNFLLNEEPDKAVDIFIKMLEVDSDTIETHLAVGKIFRKKGEVDRAIRIHQNLIARPQLADNHRNQSLFELGQDYYSAGMLDRAERVFLEVSEIRPYAVRALKVLLEIYQQEKAWENAINIARKLEENTKKSMQSVIAHYYCEMADIAYKKGHIENAHQLIQSALDADYKCVRASLLQAQFYMHAGDFKSALTSLQQIKNQNPDYLSESVASVAACYEGLNEEKKLVTYFMALLEEYPRVPVVLILSERIRKWKGDKVAADFVADYVRRYPSLAGLNLFINLHLESLVGRAKDDLVILQTLTKKLLADKPEYQCTACGFSGRTLHWQCPGCKKWSSIKPAFYLE